MRVHYGIIGVLGLLLPLPASAQEEVKVTGRVVDAAGKPVAESEVAVYWRADNDKMTPSQGATTNADGRFTFKAAFDGRSRGLLALDKERKSGALVVLDEKAAARPVSIRLGPLVHVHGKFFCKELNKRPPWTMVYLMSNSALFLGCSSAEASFSFDLPPGKYKFWGYGTDIQDVKKDVVLSADKSDVDMGTLDMPATILARHKGKAPPPWHVTDARGVSKNVKVSDLKGKWVLLEFWGYW